MAPLALTKCLPRQCQKLPASKHCLWAVCNESSHFFDPFLLLFFQRALPIVFIPCSTTWWLEIRSLVPMDIPLTVFWSHNYWRISVSVFHAVQQHYCAVPFSTSRSSWPSRGCCPHQRSLHSWNDTCVGFRLLTDSPHRTHWPILFWHSSLLSSKKSAQKRGLPQMQELLSN